MGYMSIVVSFVSSSDRKDNNSGKKMVLKILSVAVILPPLFLSLWKCYQQSTGILERCGSICPWAFLTPERGKRCFPRFCSGTNKTNPKPRRARRRRGEDGIRAHRGCIRIIASSETCYLFSPPGKERLVGGLVAGSAASPAPLYLTKHLLSLLSPASVRAGAAATSVGNWNWNPKIFGLVAGCVYFPKKNNVVLKNAL